MKKIAVCLALFASFLFSACSSADLHIGENGNRWNGSEELRTSAQGISAVVK